MAMTEDLDAFLDVDEFATAAAIGGATVNGIFDSPAADAFSDVSGTRPTFLCKEADVSGITLGTSTCLIGAVTYTIVDAKPDGVGLTTLVLEAP